MNELKTPAEAAYQTWMLHLGFSEGDILFGELSEDARLRWNAVADAVLRQAKGIISEEIIKAAGVTQQDGGAMKLHHIDIGDRLRGHLSLWVKHQNEAFELRHLDTVAGYEAKLIESHKQNAALVDALRNIAEECRSGEITTRLISLTTKALDAQSELTPRDLLAWAVHRWNDEVAQRPLVNIHRRVLDDTWRQVIRYAGGDPDRLVGPNHDARVAAQHEVKP